MRIGLIGVGTHGFNAVIPAIHESKNSQLVAVADIHGQHFDRLNGIHTYTDHRQMLAKERLDVAYIATLSDTHPALAKDAFAAGLHVVCEKPMANDSIACREMNDAARQANRHLIVNFETRFYDHFRKIREWIQAGRLGRIEAIHLQHFWDGHKNYGPSSERRARLMNLAGGLDCGIHKLDVVRYFCGGKWQEVTARGVWLGENLKKPPHIGILATLDNGVMATVNVSMGYAAQIPPRPMCEVLTIVGNRGVVSMMEDIPNVEKRVQLETVVRLFSETGEEDCRVIEPPHHIAITRLLDDLADAVDGRKSPSEEMPTGEDGLMAQIAVEQANADAIKHRVTLDK